MKLTDQCDRTWRSLKRARPRSKRRTNLERDLVWIQVRRMKREMKGKAK